MTKVAFITGASRGIGRVCALRLAREGWDIALAAKSVSDTPNLPGNIYSVAEEIKAAGAKALPIPCNIRIIDDVKNAAEKTLDTFGRVDAVINNAGALWWRDMDETPMSRFDLVMEVNVRGAFAVTEAFLPAMKSQHSGHIIMMSPPVDLSVLPGHIAYMISKFGMTMTVLGLAEELKMHNIYATALWPKTIIESYATINFKLGDPSVWRKADILADAAWEVLQHPEKSNGRALIDEDFLRDIGYTDFEKYLCRENGSPIDINAVTMLQART